MDSPDEKKSSDVKKSRDPKQKSRDPKRQSRDPKRRSRNANRSRRDGDSGPAPPPPGADTPGPSHAPNAELGFLAEETLVLAIATRATEAQFLRTQASLLAWLSKGDRVESCGFASLNSIAMEVLGIRPRTVRERLALHRTFLRFPDMEEAFLAGKMTACQVLAVAPMLADGVEWADATASFSVRELRRRAREARKDKALHDPTRRREESPEEPQFRNDPDGPDDDGDSGDPHDPEGRTVSFKAPVAFQVVYDSMIDLSRKVIGRDAPIYECMEAMLLETHWLGFGPQEKTLKPAEPRTISVRPRDDVPHRAEAISHARETLEQVRAYMKDVAELIESQEPKSPEDAVFSLKQIQLLQAPQRVLFARLIRDLRRTQAIDLLGYRSMAELVEDRLRLSERSARNRVAESLLFETDEEIARAYAAGEISIMQAHLIQRLASSVSRAPFVARAREVTWRQFQRESRLLELLKKCDLGRVANRPFPQAKVEEALIEALGGDREAIEEELRKHGIAPLPPEGSSDPAENPLLMDRLEMLVNLLALQQWDEIPKTGDADRQTFAAARPEVTIRFWAPRTIADDLSDVVSQCRKRERPWIPTWAVMTILFAQAANAWEQQDPEHRPVRSKILKRDHYRCVIPGCTSRSHLETSHNLPRSQGGTNDPENLSVVCHTHHHRGIHAGYVEVSGRAPHALQFKLGTRRGGPPLLIYKGNKLVKGAFDAEPKGEVMQ